MTTAHPESAHDVRQWTIPAALERQATSDPDRPFVTVEEQTQSYGEARRQAMQVANMLHDGGVERARMDEDGDVFFVDRIKDCIRRRGENISSFEVETALADHPDVQEVAVYAVPSEIEGAEDEVMAAVVGDPDRAPDFTALSEHAAANAPPFAVPRFYRAVAALPKTPTGKVQKHVLRADGVTGDTVDRLEGRDQAGWISRPGSPAVTRRITS